jgi:putative endonuclease
MATRAKRAGQRGERIARSYLERAGLHFVAANWACKSGEIDLVMRAGSTLVFVEVRLRAMTTYAEGFETVGYRKQRRLLLAAQQYQQSTGWWGDVRFDVVSITIDAGDQPVIEYIPHAFTE